jgi:hypothetical protein
MTNAISRWFNRLFKEKERGQWPRRVGLHELPPERLYGREGFHVNLPGAREVRNASTHQSHKPWSRDEHIRQRGPRRRMVDNSDHLRDGATWRGES